ncbi:phospholipase b-related [Anaeramoeba ignava]|uniref:Phospholipase B-like n=1 Tax=Anaeramoeba ignava TaxID=1746090 RepID=A0A9Q0LNG9_ANAIG|nr:phospholipase b-related [Anaeramoeba ignava]
MKINLFFFFLLFFIFVFSTRNFASVYWEYNDYQIEFGIADPTAICYGIFSDTLFEIGTSKLHIYTNSTYNDSIQMYAAGFVEGALTQQAIWDFFTNWKILFLQDFNTTIWPEKIMTFMNDNQDYLIEQCGYQNQTEYIKQICLNYQQFLGLIKGYQYEASPDKMMNYLDFWMLNSDGDLSSLSVALYSLSDDPKEQEWAKNKINNIVWKETNSHCTALVKVLDGNTDILFGHDTWEFFSSLSRIWKEYNFQLSSVKAETIMFSSYPGFISSVDDFYLTSQSLGVLETTIHAWNLTLFQEYLIPQTFLTWIRVQAVNRLSASGQEWTNLMDSINSGTYNCQWLILDYKLFNKGSALQDNLLWVTELIPGYTWADDQTFWLRNRTWYPSFNRPSNPFIFNISGYEHRVETEGIDWSYWNCTRMLIMERDVNEKVYSYETFKEMMRYNHYQDDPLSHGDPGNTIAPRYDLRVENSSCLDCKSLSYLEALNLQFSAVSSPVHKYVPVFTFEGKWNNFPRQGLPITWEFPWHNFESVKTTTCGDYETCEECIQSSSCGWCEERCLKYPVLVGETNLCLSDNWQINQCSSVNPSQSNSKSISTGAWIGIVFGVSIFCGVLVGIIVFFFPKKKSKKETYDKIPNQQLKERKDEEDFN